MPSLVDTCVMEKARQGLLRALRTIKQTGGYNTTPKVQMGHRPLDKIADGEFPYIAVEMGDLTPDTEQFGGASQGLVRMVWPAFIWGYVRSSGIADDLYRAGEALLIDVYAALWDDETLPDGDGAGTVMFVSPEPVRFDMETFTAKNAGYFLAEFQIVFDLTRGGSP